MAATKPGKRRSDYYARIGKKGGEATKKKHGHLLSAAPARKPKPKR